jgi:VCBS repeat-containing protein
VDVDTDDKPDQLTAVLVSGPAHGTLTLNPDGSFTYDPDDDFPGPTDTPTDSFTYMVNDGWNDSNVATVTLEFNAPMTWKVNIVPNMINLKSNGVFIAFITLPKQYRAEDVVEGSVACQGASAVRLFRHSKLFPQTFGAIFRTQGLTDVKVKDKVTLTVTGTVISEGQTLEFSGSDTVRVFNLKSRARDETEEWDRQSEKNLFDKFPNNHGKGQDRDSSGHDGRNQGYDH